MANAYISSKILNINDSDLNNDLVSYKDIKHKMCKKIGGINVFVKESAKDLSISGV